MLELFVLIKFIKIHNKYMYKFHNIFIKKNVGFFVCFFFLLHTKYQEQIKCISNTLFYIIFNLKIKKKDVFI